MKCPAIIRTIPLNAILLFSVTACFAEEPEQSEALKRFRTKFNSTWSNDLPSDATVDLKYEPISGLGFTESVIRRDPTDIIKIGELYYLWYTRSAGGPLKVGPEQATDTLRAYPWDLADIWLATSPDGYHWTEVGPAVVRGTQGTSDARSVFTPKILTFFEKIRVQQ